MAKGTWCSGLIGPMSVRFFFGAAADDRRVGPLDRDLGESGPRVRPERHAAGDSRPRPK
jgi:hypothetical protein